MATAPPQAMSTVHLPRHRERLAGSSRFSTNWSLWAQPATARRPTLIRRRSCADVVYGPRLQAKQAPGGIAGTIRSKLRRMFSQRSSSSKVRAADVPAPARAGTGVEEMDPPLPVVPRAAKEGSVSLWERRRGVALERVAVPRWRVCSRVCAAPDGR